MFIEMKSIGREDGPGTDYNGGGNLWHRKDQQDQREVREQEKEALVSHSEHEGERLHLGFWIL